MAKSHSTLPRLIGVIHLSALPGSPGSSGLHPSQALQIAKVRAVQEALLLARAGFDGIIIENFGDVPFMKDKVAPETVASMAVIVAAVKTAMKTTVRIKMGVNILRNDGQSALAVAAVTGADFIRVNVLSGVAATDQGIIEGSAAILMRERVRLRAEMVPSMGVGRVIPTRRRRKAPLLRNDTTTQHHGLPPHGPCPVLSIAGPIWSVQAAPRLQCLDPAGPRSRWHRNAGSRGEIAS